MTRDDCDRIADWLTHAGLKGEREQPLLDGFCLRCREAGLPIGRVLMLIDTLDPVYQGRGFRWREDGPTEDVLEFEHEQSAAAYSDWANSPFGVLLHAGGGELRLRLSEGETGGYAFASDLHKEAQTDYFVLVHKFAEDGVIGEMDSFSSRWTTAAPTGFSDEHLAALRRLVPLLGLAVKAASLFRVTASLAEAYLGRDAALRVLRGRIARGQVEKINAVLWFSDLKGFTSLSESMDSDHLIPFLNDHADLVITAIQGAGGDVLKLIGDGILAIFGGVEPEAACLAAWQAEADMRGRLAALHAKRSAEDKPVADIYVGLHIGDVFYGNIGSDRRLDFTVVGQAVNEVSRISSLCRSVDRDNLFSSDLVELLPAAEKEKLVSVGRFALRGVRRAKELFTRDPGLDGSDAPTAGDIRNPD